MRLLETSFLVFFGRRQFKTTLATVFALISLTVQRDHRPWLMDDDDAVANVASWVLFVWLFSLQSYDCLSVLPDVVWGVPLVLSAFGLVLFAIRTAIVDIKKRGIRDAANTDESGAAEATIEEDTEDTELRVEATESHAETLPDAQMRADGIESRVNTAETSVDASPGADGSDNDNNEATGHDEFETTVRKFADILHKLRPHLEVSQLTSDLNQLCNQPEPNTKAASWGIVSGDMFVCVGVPAEL